MTSFVFSLFMCNIKGKIKPGLQINISKMTIFNLKICLEQIPTVSPVNFYLKWWAYIFGL